MMSNKTVDALRSISLSKHHSDCGVTNGGECTCHVAEAKNALAGLMVARGEVNSCSVVLNRWSATFAIAAISNGKGVDFNLAGGDGVDAKRACMDAAKVLRDAAQRFELLATESCPYHDDTHVRIHDTKVDEMILVQRNVLSAVIDMAISHVADIDSGIEDGTYLEEDNADIEEKRQAVEAAEAIYRAAVMPS